MVVSDKRRAFGVFSNRQEAEQALNELKASGFPIDQVSVIAKEAEQGDQLSGAQMSDRIGDQDAGAGTGLAGDIATNSALGSVLIGVGSLAIPGVGVIIAAGSVATALAATVAGSGIEAAAFEGLVRAIADLGIPEQQARTYSDHLYRGDYLVIVEGTDDEIHRAEAILSDRGIQDWGIYSPATA
jgi:hypothetical protein